MFRHRRRSRFADLVRNTVVLHLTTNESIAGILLAEYDDTVAIARARLLSETSGQLVPIDGEVVVPLAKIKYVQAGVRLDDTKGAGLLRSATEGSRG